MSVRTGVDEYNQPTSDINSGYIGEFKYFGFESVPPHCLACDGSEVSRETYSELFAVFGTTYGAGNGATTFNLPDLRGAFLRCIGGNAAELGVEQGDAIRDIPAGITAQGSDSGNQTPIWAGAGFRKVTHADGTSTTNSETRVPFYSLILDVAQLVPVAAENRPINYAVNVCVVYE